MSTLQAKIVSIVVLLIVTGLSVLIPVRFHVWFSTPRGQAVLRALSCGAGGLIFSIVFLHLMPEIHEIFEGYTTVTDKHIDYPVMQVTVGFGFLLPFLLEKVIGEKFRGKKTVMQNDGQTEDAADPVSTKTEVSKETTTDGVSRQDSSTKFIPEQPFTELEMLARNPGIKEYCFVIAFSLHAVIEGLVAGFLSDTEKVFTLLIGLALHKIPEGVVLVIQLFRGRVKWQTTAAIGIFFTMLSPIGMAIATAIRESGSSESSSGRLAEAILLSLGAGILFYVVVMDILLVEFSPTAKEQPLRKCFYFLVGVLLIGGISFVPHEHEHFEEEGCNVTLHMHPH